MDGNTDGSTDGVVSRQRLRQIPECDMRLCVGGQDRGGRVGGRAGVHECGLGDRRVCVCWVGAGWVWVNDGPHLKIWQNHRMSFGG